eukprot:7894119-Pyramimonas_sp.AAC.1
MHRIAHLLAERAQGTERRQYLTTPESRPSATAVEAHMAKPSAEGGMSAVRVDRAELLARSGATAACLMER